MDAHMKTATLVSVEEYLHKSYRPDREYVDGEIQERNLGEKDHSKFQMAVAAYFYGRRREWGIQVWPEQRVQVKPTRFRVPDLCVTIGEPDEQIFTTPPFIVVEVLSPEDTVARLMERVRDYWDFGVRNIWIIDPKERCGFRASPKGVEVADVLRTEGEPMITLEVMLLFE
jgi:Uma2 family endonuclease